jgi:hypothetical protein
MKRSHSVPRVGFSPYALLLGFAIGVTVLSFAGRVVSSVPYMQFNRMHRYINPEGIFYPTASELVAVGEDAARAGAALVIVGGSSAFWGAGQGSAELWTDILQSQLGDRFKVLNFAMVGGVPTEFGGVAAQALLKRGHKVIYVADMSPALMGDAGGIRFGYIYWDALYKGLLPDYVARERRVFEAPRPASLVASMEEDRLRGLLDSWFYAADLWNWVGYSYLFTTPSVYVQLPFAWPTTGRKAFADPEQHAIIQPLDIRYSPSSVDFETRLVGGMARVVCRELPDGRFVEDPALARRDELSPDIEAAFPPEYRQAVMMALIPESTYYLDRLPEDQRACYHRAAATTADKLRAAGYSAVLGAPAGFEAEDYGDRTHLLPRGAIKLSALLAPEIASLANRLGYLN